MLAERGGVVGEREVHFPLGRVSRVAVDAVAGQQRLGGREACRSGSLGGEAARCGHGQNPRCDGEAGCGAPPTVGDVHTRISVATSPATSVSR